MNRENTTPQTRRHWLTSCAGLSIGALAGCLSSDDDTEPTPTNETETTNDSAADTETGSDDADSSDDDTVDSWPMFGYDPQNTGYIDTTGPTEDVEVQWTFEADDELSHRPVLANGLVYLNADDDQFYALDADTGAIEWQLEGIVGATPALSNDGETLFHDQDGVMYAFDALEGTERWSSELPASGYHPVVVDETVYVAAHGYIIAVDAETGDVTVLREYEDNPDTSRTPCIGDGVLFSRLDDDVCAIDLETGEEQWRVNKSIGINNRRHPGLVYSNNRLYVFIETMDLLAIDAETGDTIWEADIVSEDTWDIHITGPSVMEDFVYIGVDDVFLKMNVETGEESWKVEFYNKRITTKPTLIDDIVYISPGRDVQALESETGNVIWEFDMDDGSRSHGGMVVLDGVIYSISSDGTLYSIVESV